MMNDPSKLQQCKYYSFHYENMTQSIPELKT